MKHRKIKYALLTMLAGVFTMFINDLNAQVLINDNGGQPDQSALLEVRSSNQGLLVPRMTTDQMNAISSPVDGLLIFNTTFNLFAYYDAGLPGWQVLNAAQPPVEGFQQCGDPLTYGDQTYGTVEIGTQCWMAENLNIGTEIPPTQNQLDNSVIEKYCNSDAGGGCSLFGGMYQWTELMNYQLLPGGQGICPEGWHIPTAEEWNILTTSLGGNAIAGGKLKRTEDTYWNPPNTGATNESGFGAVGGGLKGAYGANFQNLLMNGNYWTSTEAWSGASQTRVLRFDEGGVNVNINQAWTAAASVRCLKNPE